MIHGRYSTYIDYRCRCRRCGDAMRVKREELAARPCPEHLHGWLAGYNTYKCRCAPCTKVKADENARYYRAKKAAG